MAMNTFRGFIAIFYGFHCDFFLIALKHDKMTADRPSSGSSNLRGAQRSSEGILPHGSREVKGNCSPSENMYFFTSFN